MEALCKRSTFNGWPGNYLEVPDVLAKYVWCISLGFMVLMIFCCGAYSFRAIPSHANSTSFPVGFVARNEIGPLQRVSICSSRNGISACRAIREPIMQRRRELSLSIREISLGRENNSVKLGGAVTVSVPIVINVIFGLPSKFNRKCEMCGHESDSTNSYVDLDGKEGALCQTCFLKRVRPPPD